MATFSTVLSSTCSARRLSVTLPPVCIALQFQNVLRGFEPNCCAGAKAPGRDRSHARRFGRTSKMASSRHGLPVH